MVDEAHVALVAAVVVALVAGPFVLGDGGAALAESFAELMSPVGMLLLPVSLILLIHFLSSDRATTLSHFFSTACSRDSIHQVGGSPIGVALFLLLILFLLYHRISILGGGGDGGGDE